MGIIMIIFKHLIITKDYIFCIFFFYFKQKTAYELRISDWSSDVCSSDLRALERLLQSPIFEGLPVHVVMADTDSAAHREALELAATRLKDSRTVETTLQKGRPEAVISANVERTPHAMLVMGAYGHSPIRTLHDGRPTKPRTEEQRGGK